MAKLLLGAPAANALAESLHAESGALCARGVYPALTIVRVGARGADLAYERAAVKRCEQCGVTVRRVALPDDIPQSSLLTTLAALNAANDVHGILLLRPLSDRFNDAEVCASVTPEKDVDGITGTSMSSVYSGTGDGFAPCTAAACIALLKHYGIPIDGKRAVVVGRSFVIGKPASMLLLNENATVSIAHTHTRDLPTLCREADILIVAAGARGLVGAEHVRPGQTVIDVGIHTAPDGSLRGDVRFDEVAPIVGAITPVPGGVGSLTTAILCEHVVSAAKKGVR